MITYSRRSDKQAGIVLLEALIAILIFSMGILAIVGMQAVAAKQVTDAKYRSDACLLVNQLIGTMWASDRTPATLKANFDSSVGGAGYTVWLTDVSTTLPGVAANPPAVDVSASTGAVTVTVFWLAPSEVSTAIAHRYVALAQVR